RELDEAIRREPPATTAELEEIAEAKRRVFARDRACEQRRRLRRGREVAALAELPRTGAVIAEARRVQHRVHVVAERDGGARRVGAAITRELHRAGCQVVIHYRRSRADADALAVELNGQRPGSAAVESADLADVAQCADLVARAVARWGGLDVLVNNASTF